MKPNNFWQSIPASEFCNSVRDGTHDSPKFVDAGYPLITSKNIKLGQVITDGANLISESDYKEISRRSKVDQWDLLFSMIGTVGEVCLVRNEEPAFAIKNVGLFKAGDELKGRWLYYWFLNPETKASFKQIYRGASQQYIPLGELRQLPIPVPNDPGIMLRVVDVLSVYDELIENNRRRMALLEDSARLLYREWFVRLRFPGHEHTRVVDGVPEGWERASVPQMIRINPSERIEKEEAWYVPMAALSEGGMCIDAGECERRNNYTNVKFRNGDVLFARITPCLENGKTGYVNFLEDDEIACGSTEFIVLRGSRVSSYFTYCLARTYDFRENAIKSMVGSSGRQRVQTSCFDEFFVLTPPHFILEQFDEVAGNIFSQIRNLQKQNTSLIQARDLLLPRLMSGEIAV